MKPEFKITYVLVKATLYRNPVPIPCVGRNGTHHGYYKWDEKYRGMVLKLSEEIWVGNGKVRGAGADIVSKKGQHLQPHFFVEVELIGDVAAQSQELLELKLRLETNQARLEDALQAFGQASIEGAELLMLRAKLDKALLVPGAPTEDQIEIEIMEDLKRMQEAADQAKAAAILSDPAAAYELATNDPDAFAALGGYKAVAHVPVVAEKDDPDWKILAGKNHRQLRDLCRGANTHGADIPLTNPTKDKMIAALLANREALKAAFTTVSSA